MDNINFLPVKILEQICSYLDLTDQKSARAVCRHWRRVLSGIQFQRQCLISLSSPFAQEVPDSEKQVIRKFRNIKLFHWFEENDEYEADSNEHPGNNTDTVFLKYLFEPTPEMNIRQLLFENEMDVEVLDMRSSFESCREILGDRLSQMQNLRELTLTFGQSLYVQPDQSVWMIVHNRIETLNIDISCSRAYNIALPSLTTLELLTNCRWSFHIIQTYCRQLQRLKVQFQDLETMDEMMSLSFPMLTHLHVRMHKDKNVQLRYAQTQNQSVDNTKEENFVKSMPKLKSIWLESDLMLFRIGKALAKYSHHLDELTLMDMQIDAAELHTIETFPKLKTMSLHRVKILTSPQSLPKVNMPHLISLTLVDNESDIVFDNGLAGLKSLKVTFSTARSDKILHKICNYLTNLERLEFRLTPMCKNNAFRDLNRLTKLKLLQINGCGDICKINWTQCPVVPSVRRIVFFNSYCNGTKMLQPIPRVFPGLLDVHLDMCYVTCMEEDGFMAPDGKGRLDDSREAKRKCMEQWYSTFPKCRISFKHTTLQWKHCD
ncbi:uncharacterized protein LOC128734044 [Sabethes cyaneus]|uniref:uncharacterized protein LOC128734044 n=1 Tax=Sabethes cyaneus TaxID=53552 RepID=UPI00237D583E|nr:uncharacterized protein LOC128734044 [Sabethes cyaneus]XP_053684000.1 uncharacterized protein LOC128734044 [Sabethes cyaneus]